MRAYLKNKNFIPEKFFHKVQLKEEKRAKDIIFIFLIANLCLIPKSINYITVVNEKPVSNMENVIKNPRNFEKLNIWINNVFNDWVEEAHINNNNGELVVNDFDKIYKLGLNSSVKVTKANQNNDKYTLGVSLNE